MKPPPRALSLPQAPWAKVVIGGLFISNGRGTHPDRILNDYELIVVRKGTLAIWEDDVRFEVPPGHALILYPGRRHRGAAPFGRDLSFYWIHFVVTPSRRTKRSLPVPQFVKLQRANCVAELFHRYLDDTEAGRMDPFYANLLLQQMLCEVARKPVEREPSRGTVLAGQAEAYVIRHLAEKLSAARIARALRINADYLNRVFRALHRMTITEYIHRRRVEYASGLLRETTDGTAEIAEACGFTNARYFSHLFKRYRGVTPQGYRRLMPRAYVNAR